MCRGRCDCGVASNGYALLHTIHIVSKQLSSFIAYHTTVSIVAAASVLPRQIGKFNGIIIMTESQLPVQFPHLAIKRMTPEHGRHPDEDTKGDKCECDRTEFIVENATDKDARGNGIEGCAKCMGVIVSCSKGRRQRDDSTSRTYPSSYMHRQRFAPVRPIPSARWRTASATPVSEAFLVLVVVVEKWTSWPRHYVDVGQGWQRPQAVVRELLWSMPWRGRDTANVPAVLSLAATCMYFLSKVASGRELKY